MVDQHADGASAPGTPSSTLVGRCEMFDAISTGSMATIHIGRMLGAGGFARTVAIKRLHPQFALDQEFAQKLRDEARLLARIRHPNVVPMLDLVEESGNAYLIMEYVEGLDLARLLAASRAKGERVPPPMALRIGVGMLQGLHAAHEATDGRGELLKIVHRDVSPPNILVGTDGFTRLLDFGTARALGKLATSRTGQSKRASAYLSPEQALGKPLDRRSDVFAAAAVIWECLTGQLLFDASDPLELFRQITEAPIRKPSEVAPDVPHKWDGIVMRGLERLVGRRWKTAMAMADAAEAIGGIAPQRELGDWVRRLGAERLAELSAKVAALEAKPVRGGSARSRVDPRSQLRIDPVAVEQAKAEAERLAALSEEGARALGAAQPTPDEGGATEPASSPRPGPVETAEPPDQAPGSAEAPSAPEAAPAPAAPVNGEVSSTDIRAPRRSLTAVASSVGDSGTGRRGKLWLGLGVGGLLVAVGLGWALRSGDDRPETGEPAANRDPGQAASPSDAAAAAPSPTSPETAPATSPGASPTSSATATASASAPSPATAQPSARPTATRTATRPGSLYSRD